MYDYECDTCDRQFMSQRACDQHMDALGHHDTRPECDTCARRFNTWASCKQHMNSCSHWIFPYECDTCTTRFRYASDADNHMDEADHWSYPYDCETCTSAFRTAAARDDHQDDEGHYAHLHCRPCDRYFQSADNLRQHQRSRAHRGAAVACPFCAAAFATASGVAHHLEAGAACPRAPRGLDRAAIHRALRARDPAGLITERLLEWSDDGSGGGRRPARWDPAIAWNGDGFECYLCRRVFESAKSLGQHVESPAHQAPLYHCPGRKRACGAEGGRKFVSLAALFNHLESESCGYVRFDAVQRGVGNFLAAGGRKTISFH